MLISNITKFKFEKGITPFTCCTCPPILGFSYPSTLHLIFIPIHTLFNIFPQYFYTTQLWHKFSCYYGTTFFLFSCFLYLYYIKIQANKKQKKKKLKTRLNKIIPPELPWYWAIIGCIILPTPFLKNLYARN